ncbi:ABC transporter permease [Lacrimispora sp.]|uniref:ABC transporter permease n=1 Tax=Lacrimispora sp. TaxID=2719234 RepID=UPI0028A73A78|nr:ABC transporter permease [Lacrimispora sp.]
MAEKEKDLLGTEANMELLMKERRSNHAWNKLKRNRTAVLGFAIVCFMVLMAIFAPVLAPYKPNTINPGIPFKGIGFQGHILGTDDLGRDILSRILYGARVSLIVAAGATLVGAALGVLVGLLAGYCGGAIDTVLMRFMDGLFSFPFILLSMILITVLGNGVINVIFAIGIASVPGFARITRGQVLAVKEEEYCNACRVIGISHCRLLFAHIFPNCVSQIIVYGTLRIANAIISEASLSFLGLGIALPTASWGSSLRVGRDCLTTAPHVAGVAGAVILVTVVGFNLLGDGIRDVMDPKMRQ